MIFLVKFQPALEVFCPEGFPSYAKYEIAYENGENGPNVTMRSRAQLVDRQQVDSAPGIPIENLVAKQW